MITTLHIYSKHPSGETALSLVDRDGQLELCDDNTCVPVQSRQEADKKAAEQIEAWANE